MKRPHIPEKVKARMEKAKKPINVIFLIVIIVLALCFYFPYSARSPSTDDAYVRSNTVYVAARVSGEVAQVYIRNLQQIKKGQPLFDLDPAPFQAIVSRDEAALELAEQNVESAYADIDTARKDLAAKEATLIDTENRTQRNLDLAKQGFVSKQGAVDARTALMKARADVAASKSQLVRAVINAGKPGALNAQVKQAAANLRQAQLNLTYTHVIAPADGTLINVDLRPGAWVNAGDAQFVLIENNDYWVDANFKETKLSIIKPGMQAQVLVDMYQDHPFNAVVMSVSHGSGDSFALLPPENATGNWVKVTRRFAVRLHILNPTSQHPFRYGSTATVTIDTTKPLLPIQYNDDMR